MTVAIDWIFEPFLKSPHVFCHRMLRGPFPFFAAAHELGLLERVPGVGGWLDEPR
jgi:hypothetical protein